VRSIPYSVQINEAKEIWSSPDFFLTRKKGTALDHALLMASMFRACQFETYKEFDEYKNVL